MIRARQTFSKSERLCSVKLISDVFETGNLLRSPNLKLLWKISTSELPSPAQIVITVPRKNIKKAVARNIIKRRLREAYRKNKIHLYDVLIEEKTQLLLIMIYKPCRALSYNLIEKSVSDLIRTLCNNVKQDSNNS
jgi:ribonuclease P protein component